MNPKIKSTDMKLLLLQLCFNLQCLTGITFCDGSDVIRVVVGEGSDVILPCSLGNNENIEPKLFAWKKDGQEEVFMYDAGIHYNNGHLGQDEKFKGRVFHFQDELNHGNASIIIRNTQAADSGDYTCVFPHLQPEKIFHIELVVVAILKDRSKENIKGAAPKPSVTILDQTKEGVLLQCVVRGASPKPHLQWKDRAGNILPAKEPQVSERGGKYDITLNTTVTKTDRYRCVVTQEEINHQTEAEIHVYINGSDVIRVVVGKDSDVILPCSLGNNENIESEVFDWKKDGQKEVFMYDGGIHYNNGRAGQDEQFKGRVFHFQDELKHGNASIIIRNTKVADSGNYTCVFPHLQPEKIFHIELVVGAILKDRSKEKKGASKPSVTILDETKDWSLLQCVVRGASPKPKVEWKDSAGNILPAKEPQVTERGGSYDVILQTTVTKTDNFSCVVTQEEISHQTEAKIYVHINDSTGWIVAVLVVLVVVVVLVLVVVMLCIKLKKSSGSPTTTEAVHLNY